MIKDKWYICPECQKEGRIIKLARYEESTISEKVYVRCRYCKNEIEIKINK